MAKELTNSQKDILIEQYVELVVDNMDTKSLVQFVSEELTDYYDKLTDNELKEQIINTHEEELYDELVDNVTSLNDNEEPWLQPLFLSNLLQREQEQVNGASILCALIVNQSAKFITLVGQDYSVNNVKNVLINLYGV